MQHIATLCNILYRTSIVLQDTAANRNTLHHTATHCHTLPHTATHCQGIATYCSTLQHSTALFNILQHTASRCQHTATHCQHTATHSSTLQHTARHTGAHCNILQHTATHCNTLQRTDTFCSMLYFNTLQHITSHSSTLQHTATLCNTLETLFYFAIHLNPLQHPSNTDSFWQKESPITQISYPSSLSTRKPTLFSKRKSGDIWILLVLRIQYFLVQIDSLCYFQRIFRYNLIACFIPLYRVLYLLGIRNRLSREREKESTRERERERRTHVHHTGHCSPRKL